MSIGSDDMKPEPILSKFNINQNTLVPMGLIGFLIAGAVWATTLATKVQQHDQDILTLRAQMVLNTQGVADATSKYALLAQSIETLSSKIDDLKKALGK